VECSRQAVPRGEQLGEEWRKKFDAYKQAFPNEATESKASLAASGPGSNQKWLSTGPVVLPHDHVLALLPSPLEFAELAVGIAFWMLFTVFLPEQFDGQVPVLLELISDVFEARLRPFRRFRRG